MLIDNIRTKKLKLTEMVNLSSYIFRENFIAIVYITLLVFFPINILSTIINNKAAAIMNTLNIESLLTDMDLMAKFVATPQYQQMAIYQFIGFLLQLFFVPIGTMAAAKLAEQYCYGRKIRYKEAILDAVSKGPVLIFTSILYAVLISLGTLAFLIPGLILMLFWFFYVYAIILRDQKGFSAFRYSTSLIKGNILGSIGMIIAIYFMNYGFNIIINYIFSWGYQIFAVQVLASTLSSLVSIYFFVITAVWFMNRDAVVYGVAGREQL